MSGAHLYAIAQQYRADLDALADLEGLDAQTIADTLEAMQGELQDKLRAVIAYALHKRAEGDAQAAAAKRMADRAKATHGTADGLLDYALQAMQATGIAEVSTDEFSAKVAKKPPAVVIADGAELPAEFLRTKTVTEPDKSALKAALTQGREIAGASLVAGWRLALR